MSDLDKRLLEALDAESGESYVDTKAKFIVDAVKQAFIENEWYHIPRDIELKSLNSSQMVINPKKSGLMTQSEWEAKAIKDGWVKPGKATIFGVPLDTPEGKELEREYWKNKSINKEVSGE